MKRRDNNKNLMKIRKWIKSKKWPISKYKTRKLLKFYKITQNFKKIKEMLLKDFLIIISKKKNKKLITSSNSKNKKLKSNVLFNQRSIKTTFWWMPQVSILIKIFLKGNKILITLSNKIYKLKPTNLCLHLNLKLTNYHNWFVNKGITKVLMINLIDWIINLCLKSKLKFNKSKNLFTNNVNFTLKLIKYQKLYKAL